MTRFASYDGTQIGYRTLGDGPPLVCLPGGPGRTGEYFGDLGGLARSRRLIIPDTRGTGQSADAADPQSYRCDRLVGDVEALRAHLGLDRMDLLAHSAAGNLAVLYAATHPGRLEHLVLLDPGLTAVGIEVPGDEWNAAVEHRSAEPWYPAAMAAIEKAAAGEDSMENRRVYMPFFYARWDDAAQAHMDVGISDRSAPVRQHYGAEGAFDPDATRQALQRLTAPVLMYVGELDANPTPETAAKAARLFPNATVTVQPRSAHFAWVDDPGFFVRTITTFLG
jgi:pimeloyl-ACP methyl ester carboxylesterase